MTDEQEVNQDEQSQGFDNAVANQLTAQLLAGAIHQQQLNATLARNAVAGACNALTTGVQLTHLAMLQKVTGVAPVVASQINGES